jgi:hypothetical protein
MLNPLFAQERKEEMNNKLLLFVSVQVLLLLLAAGLIYAQGAEPRGGIPQSNDSGLLAPLGDGFTYQGQLKDGGGNPVDDSCDFTFSLWDNENGGSQIGWDSTVAGVTVADGYFATVVNRYGEFATDAFTGDERWLEIAVKCSADPAAVTLSPRQLLSGTPYALTALSLQPGAVISGTASTVLKVINNATGSNQALIGRATAASGSTIGVLARSDSTSGRGLYGFASADSGETRGVYGRSDSPTGYGVYGYNSGGGWAGYFDGDVEITGAAVGFFPRPAYDSGWQYLDQGNSVVLTHNLGGDVNNYVVDFMCEQLPGSTGINITYFGGNSNGTNYRGGSWHGLTNTQITLSRWTEDGTCHYSRVRIWVYE